ncbi:MAG: glycosyltransferase family 8 protein [Acholeplasmataceae bacterium]|nr:glycosyltransferase family 8 protein [Acholeplasmataceae bacterium]
MNILVTLNIKYLQQLEIMLHSILNTNPGVHLDVYIISKELQENDVFDLKGRMNSPLLMFHLLHFDDTLLVGAPTSARYPLEIYYRLFAAKVLPPEVNRVLYLDPDIVVLKSLESLYNSDFEGNYFIGATHVRNFLRALNRLRVKAKTNAHYINTGVMLMNIEKLREEQSTQEVYDFINKKKLVLTLPDQDIIFALYGDKIKLVDHLLYNLSDRMLTVENLKIGRKINLEWVKDNTVIIHYCGRNKPWRSKYRGVLDVFYKEIETKILSYH